MPIEPTNSAKLDPPTVSLNLRNLIPNELISSSWRLTFTFTQIRSFVAFNTKFHPFSELKCGILNLLAASVSHNPKG